MSQPVQSLNELQKKANNGSPAISAMNVPPRSGIIHAFVPLSHGKFQHVKVELSHIEEETVDHIGAPDE